MAKTSEDYFWAKVLKDGPLPKNLKTRCWTWRGEMRHGYGRFTSMQGGRRLQKPAHRFMWELVNKKSAGALYVLHECDNSACVNPDHLYTGTAQQNMLDAIGRKRLNPARGEWSPHAKLTEVKVLELREARANGEQVGALAKRYGVSKTVTSLIIRGLLWKHVGGPIQGKSTTAKLSRVQEAQLVREYQAGVLSGILCDKFNITRGTVNNILKRYGVSSRSPGRPPGLSTKGVAQVRKMYTQQKMSMTAIAEQFGVSATAVHRAVHGAYAPKHGIV